MKLYKIKVLHGSPKNSWTDIYTYTVAENDEQVYNWLRLKASWNYYEEENETFKIYDAEYQVIGTETFKEKILRIKGDANDEDLEWADVHYGITAYGWVDMGDITNRQILVLKNLNIIVDASQLKS